MTTENGGTNNDKPVPSTVLSDPSSSFSEAKPAPAPATPERARQEDDDDHHHHTPHIVQLVKEAAAATLEAVDAFHGNGTPHGSTVDETASDAFSHASSSGVYQVIEYDFDGGGILTDLEHTSALTIEDNSPAAEAIKANAEVKVSTMAKAARAVNMQIVRKIVKRATLTTKSGHIKGKPPRIPTGEEEASAGGLPMAVMQGGLEPVEEEEELTQSEALLQHQGSSQQVLQPVPPAAPSAAAAPPASPKQHMHREMSAMGLHNMPENGHIPDSVVAGTVEASKKVLGALDPHDMLKLLKWRRKKRNSHKPKPTKSYVKGKVIDGEHELYTLSIAVMIGVRTSISKTNVEINGAKRRFVKSSDFRATEKYEFRPKGGGLTPPHQLSHTFKFKDYSPVVFAFLRRLSGVNDFDFLLSVCGNANFIEFISNAKSGQFFFYSSDGRFMIKTMTNAESKFLRRILPSYFRHCVESPNTMITKFLGMYRVKLYHLRRNVKFVIMNSVYFTDKYLQIFYDLKGSVIGRDAKPGQGVKKDNDMRRSLPTSALALTHKARGRVRNQLVRDCYFLRDMGVMDYSMLVGVHHIPATDDRSIATSGMMGSRLSSRRGFFSSSHSDHHLDTDTLSSGPKRQGEGSNNGEATSLVLPPELEEQHHSPQRSSSISSLNPPPLLLPSHPDVIGSTGEHTPRRNRQNSQSSECGKGEAAHAFFFEDGLEDDDNSYLLGSSKRPDNQPNSGGHFDNDEAEWKKQQTIEKLYWPFHRLFDLHGHRRMRPVLCPKCSERPCVCHCEEDSKLLGDYKIPEFIAPLSERKDGGLEMDTAGLTMPMIFKGPTNHTYLPYEGKIFYMGVIDILQEYTTRKALESQYRYMQTRSSLDPSCVPPGDYADRFIHFFDEYTQRGTTMSERGNAGSSTVTRSPPRNEGIELSDSELLPTNIAKLIEKDAEQQEA